MQLLLLDAVTAAASEYADSSGFVRMSDEAICIAAHL
jgi:hypothetical protein